MADIAHAQRTRHGSTIVQPLTHREGRLKVIGSAHYAADHHPRDMLHAVMAVASIARGRVISFVEEEDPHVNALDIKGVGEIGITGTAGAIANAIAHTTGIRVREIPITLDKLV